MRHYIDHYFWIILSMMPQRSATAALEAAWRAADIFRGYFCHAAHRHASVQIARRRRYQRKFIEYNSCAKFIQDSITGASCAQIAQGNTYEESRFGRDDISYISVYRIRVYARRASQKHEHFSLSSHTKCTHACTYARVPVSCGVNCIVAPLLNERASK